MEEKTDALALRECESTALTVYERMGDPMVAVEKLGKWFAASGLLGVKTPEQGNVVALTCMIEKITPLEFARTYDIIEGKPSKKSAAMQAEFQRRGGRFEFHETTAKKCRATAMHPAFCPNGQTLEVTLEELVQSGVAMCWDKDNRGKQRLKDNYQRAPRQMLRARVVAELVRMIDPSINAGLYAAEELDDDRPAPGPAPAWAASQSKPEEAAAVDPEAPKSNGQQRAKKAIAAFKGMGVLQADLELFAGGFEHRVPPVEWTDGHYAAFTNAKDQIKSADMDKQASVTRELFHLEPGAEG